MDFFEIGIPVFTFVTLFLVMLLQIFFRYFLKPLIWPLELSLFCYLWTILFAVGYGLRDDSHTTFDLVYDNASPLGQRIMRIVGNALVVSSFVIALYPSYRYVSFMGFKKSDALRLPMGWVYAPYLLFMVIIIGRLGAQLIVDIRSLVKADQS